MYQKFIETINNNYLLNIINRFVFMIAVSFMVVFMTKGLLNMKMLVLFMVETFMYKLCEEIN